jgi:hypothetical protein
MNAEIHAEVSNCEYRDRSLRIYARSGHASVLYVGELLWQEV